MLPQLKTIFAAILFTTLAGVVVGLLVGKLTDEPLLWIGLMAAGGFAMGIVFAYGFLPEQ